MKRKVEGPRDVISYLLEDAWKDGSDTTASTLTSIFYELVKLPGGVARLHKEITDLQQAEKPISNQNLQTLPFLDGIINETLRLYPPAGVLQRKTPPEGITVEGTFVPGDMTVFCPFYAMGRSSSH